MKRYAILFLVLSALCVRNGRADTTYYDTVTWDFGSSLIVNAGITAKFMPGSTVDATGATLVGFPGGSGASSFLGLVDTPSSYTGQGGNFVAVNAGATALVFVPAPTGGGGGTVTNFTAGNLAPLFNTSVTNPSTTPALAFSLSTVGANLFFGNETGVTAAPHYVQPSFANLSGDFALTQTPSLAAGSLVGRTSTGAGDWQAITVGTGLTMTGTTLASAAGNVSNSGTPLVDQTAVWTDATHVKGVTTLKGGLTGQVLKKLDGTDYNWVWAADLGGGSAGASVFTELGDVPPSYLGSGGKLVAVNSGATGLEFIPVPAGGVTSVFGRTGAVTALVGDYSAFYQPLDSDLTAIATLTTDPFGRGLLPLTTASAVRTYIGAGTSSFDGTFTSLSGKPTTIAGYGITDAYTKVQSDAQYQPLDADLTSLAGATLTNSMYYRSAVNTWAGVTVGANLSFGSGTLAAGNANWDTAYADRLKWDGQSTGLNAATGRSSLGLVIGTNVQAWGADLDALESLSGTNNIYYRSGLNTWSSVVIGSGLSFTGGTLSSTAGGGDVSGPVSSVDLGLTVYSGTTGKSIRQFLLSGLVTLTAGVVSVTTDNSANWNTAATDALKWNGQATGLVAATGRTSLGATTLGTNLFTAANPTVTSWMKVGSGGAVTFEDAPTTKTSLNLDVVTNDVQTKASIVPNTVPTAGQLLVGSGTAYVARAMSGVGSLTAAGVFSLSNVPNSSLANSSIQIGNTGSATVLGGTATADNIIGATGLGYVKRTGSSIYTATTTSIPNGDLANNSIQIGNTGGGTTATVLGGTATADNIIGATGLGYMKRTAANTYSATTTSIPNGDLANSSMTIATNSTALGGTVTQDQITGLSGVGLVKHTAANAMALAVAGTDYKVGTQNTINIRMVTTTSTFTPTAGVTALYFEGVGGGGGGGSINITNTAYGGGGGGGGGGGYAATYIGTPAASYSITIGVGGAGGVGTANNPGGNGGDTIVGTILTAGGGGGGGGANGGYFMYFETGLGGDGGVGTVGNFLTSGNDGGSGTAGATNFVPPSTFSGSGVGGSGGSSMFGGGAKPPAPSTAGNVGGKYGGGGSGGCITGLSAGVGGRAGGAGFAGIVRVWEIF